MLNQTAYWVQPSFAPKPGVDTYAILDPDTAVQLGLAAERPPRLLRRLFRSAFGRNLLRTTLDVCETVAEGQRLVFTLHEMPSLWRPCLAMTDPQGHPMCRLVGVFATVAGGFNVRDPGGELLGRIVCESLERRYVVQGRTGLRIGMIEEQTPNGLAPSTAGTAGYFITVADRPECGEVARLLLLAAALSLDLVYRDRVGADPEPPFSNRSGSGQEGSRAAAPYTQKPFDQ